MSNSIKQTRNSAEIATGIALLSVGSIFLIRNMGVDIPNWIISWPMLLVVTGLVSGAKHQFKKPSAFLLIGLGVLFLLKKFLFISISVFPVFLIGFGLWMILKRQEDTKQLNPNNTLQL